MRIEGFELEMASQFAANIAYSDLKKIGKVPGTKMSKNNGVRFLQDGGWRGIDLYEVVKALQLSTAGNKIMLLRLLKRAELLKLIRRLDKSLMIYGLRFFSKEKLVRLMMSLPKAFLIKMLLHVLPIHKLIKLLPTREIFNLLRSEKLDNRALLRGFRNMDPKFLLHIMGKLLNIDPAGMRHDEIMQVLFFTKKHLILNAMKSLPFKALQPFLTGFVLDDPRLLERLSQGFLFKLFDSMPKNVLMTAFHQIPEDLIMKLFISQLDDKFLVLVAAQMDGGELGKYLIAEQPQLLGMLAGVDAA